MACCSRKLTVQILLGILQGVIVLAQGTLLNYYILSHFSSTNTSYFFFLGDFLCIFIFAGTLTIAYRYLIEHRNQKKSMNQSFLYSPKRFLSNYSVSKFGVLPMIYISWIFYALLLMSKIVVIFTSNIPNNLSTKDVAGPQLLQIGIALALFVFLILVEGHNWAQKGSPRYIYVKSVCVKTGFEILDTVSFLTILVTQLGGEPAAELTPAFNTVIIVISGINFLLPTLILYKLSLGSRSCEHFAICITVLHSLLHICLIDLPFLCVRIFLWVKYHHNASIFIMKNAFGIIDSLRNIYPDLKAWCLSDGEKLNRRLHYLPSEKVLFVDECVGDDDKRIEQMDELKKINSPAKGE